MGYYVVASPDVKDDEMKITVKVKPAGQAKFDVYDITTDPSPPIEAGKSFKVYVWVRNTGNAKGKCYVKLYQDGALKKQSPVVEFDAGEYGSINMGSLTMPNKDTVLKAEVWRVE